MATATAGVGGLNIAETFPAGRGSPQGCGLRAVFCTDAASARPEACRDKSKAPRSGDVAGRSPGVQGAAAIGRPLCAPCARRDITRKTYRERNVPGNNTEQTFFPGRNCCKPITVSTLSCLFSPGKRRAAGERRGNYAKMALQIASLTCCVDALPFISGVFGPLAITCSIAARMPLCAA